MSIIPGKKAELDKEGISIDIGKAQLDKEGITLRDEEGTTASSLEDTSLSLSSKSTDSYQKRSRFLFFLSFFFIVFFITGGVFWYQTAGQNDTYIPYANDTLSKPDNVYSSHGDIILDPFMVLYDTDKPRESGVLLAQLSIQTTPEAAANIESNLFSMRTLICERLSTNAWIYSKNELSEMIREDLKEFSVKDVAFIQFESR